MNYFVFLAIEDEDVVNLLLCLRTIFLGRRPSTPIHVTLRGPYPEPVSAVKLADWESTVNQEPLFITNVGRFSNPDSQVVYLEVVNDKFGKIWYKPDFPVRKYGRNPHITLYKGQDKNRAEAVWRFLRNERLALRCDEFRLYCHGSKTSGLFDHTTANANSSFQALVDLGKVKFDILERAMAAVNDHKFAEAMPTHKDPYTLSK